MVVQSKMGFNLPPATITASQYAVFSKVIGDELKIYKLMKNLEETDGKNLILRRKGEVIT